jgi:hypothetical protein
VIIRTVAVMPLRRITDLTWKETLFGQLLGYGTFRFESAGQKQGLDEITYLPHADALYKTVSELMFGSDFSTTPVSDDEDGSGSMDDGESQARDPRNGVHPPSGRRDTAPIPRVRPSADGDR